MALTLTRSVDHAFPRSRPARESESPKLRLLNGFHLALDRRVIELPMSAQRLVAFLALTDRLALRGYVAGTLWPEASEEHAAASLRSVLWRLHQLAPDLVNSTRSHVALASAVLVDVRVMARLAARLFDPDAECYPSDFDLELLSGDLLPDWYDEWVIIERERVRQLRLHGLEAMCRRLTIAQRYGEAIQAAMSAVAEEPLRETAHLALIQVHLAEGNVAEAIRHYSAYRRTLFDELGVDPSPVLEDVLHHLHARSPQGGRPGGGDGVR
jgi:DNA-binding SARP family transcriptional activator